jgi:amino acid transporter
MVFAQVGALVLLVVVGAIQLIFGGAPDTSITVSLSWLNPFDAPSYSALLSALLLGVFIYWGWESAVNLTEETEDGSHAAGLAGVVSVVVLLATYVGVAIVVLGIAGVDKLQRFDDNSNILGNIADDVLGPLSFLVALAIITSGIASTQTTILPASRTSLSMAAQEAFPRIFARIHPRFLTPDFSTIVIGVVATVWYVGASIVSDNFLFDSLSALSLMIAFYYALTGVACVIYWRRELTRSVKNFLFIGVAPLLGAAGLFYLLVESARDLYDPKASYTGTELFGIGVPLAIAIAFTVLGLILMMAWRLSPDGKPFFERRGFETVSKDIADETTAGRLAAAPVQGS